MERLQKVLAQAGVASRRKCEELIVNGKVTVDGAVVTELGTKVDPSKQSIAVDGQVMQAERKLCFVLHKPTSYVTTVTDPEGRRTVMDLLEGVRERVYPVGRLDYDSSGLLLFSNDGELTNRLLHPSKLMDKVYRATIVGMPEKEQIKKLELGVRLEDGVTKPAKVFALKLHPIESVLEITIHEGKNRQIRRMCEAIGYPVKRLKRVQFGPIEMGSLPPSRWRPVTAEEWKALYDAAGLPAPAYPFAQEKRSDVRSSARHKSKRKDDMTYTLTEVEERQGRDGRKQPQNRARSSSKRDSQPRRDSRGTAVRVDETPRYAKDRRTSRSTSANSGTSRFEKGTQTGRNRTTRRGRP